MNRAFAKILSSGNTIGNGFLLRSGYLVTCAHVIRDALNISRDNIDCIPNFADGFLEAEFHWQKDPDSPSLFPLKFQPHGYRYDGEGYDISILSFCSNLPNIKGLRLSEELKSQEYPAWSQPHNPNVGRSPIVKGTIEGTEENGLLLFRPKDPNKASIENGCSGAPIFMKNNELVEGIVRVIDNDTDYSYAVSASVIAEVEKELLTKLTVEDEISQLETFDQSQNLNDIHRAPENAHDVQIDENHIKHGIKPAVYTTLFNDPLKD